MKDFRVVLMLLACSLLGFSRLGFGGGSPAESVTTLHFVPFSDWELTQEGEPQSIPAGDARYAYFDTYQDVDLKVEYDVDGRVNIYLMTKAQADRAEDHDPVEEGRDYITRDKGVSGSGYFIQEQLPRGHYALVLHNPGRSSVRSTYRITARRPQ